jgi:lipid II:glycine glycyltransferase (peptidoglycan interpeptide bridge formation enzyme)
MSPNVEIRLVRKEGVGIGAILTLRHRRTVVYKYGCSDERFHHLGGMPYLFWKLIDESKAAGDLQIDFGRTDLENRGLIEFKDRLGAARRQLTYFRYPKTAVKKSVVTSYLPAARHLFSVLPDGLSSLAGRLLYRHIA